MKRLILLVVLLCGTALWPQPSHPSIAFGPDLVLRRDAAHTLVPRDSVPQELRIYSTYTDALHYIGRKSSDLGRTWQPLLSAQEIVTLATPVVPPANTTCRVERLTLEPLAGRIYVQLLGSNGEASSKVYDSTTTPTGATLLHNLNTGNFSVTSLINNVHTRLKLDGVCVGTVSGTPQH